MNQQQNQLFDKLELYLTATRIKTKLTAQGSTNSEQYVKVVAGLETLDAQIDAELNAICDRMDKLG